MRCFFIILFLFYVNFTWAKIESVNEFKCIFCHLDEIFISEIRNAENQLNYYGASFLCFWKYANNKQNLQANHPIIHKYFHFMFADD